MLLTAGALSLLGVGLAAEATGAEEQFVLGTTVTNDVPGELAFRTTEEAEIQLFVDKINDLRTSRGLSPLTSDPELSLTASAWTVQMSQTGQLEHAADLSLGISADWRKLGENVGVAPVTQLDELFEAFVASPTHLANLIDPSFDFIGIGVVHVGDELWMTQRFMDVSPETAGVKLG
ncbi:MAG: CAP domain-containing protein [Acidimicrobiales bacterium]